MLATFAEHEGQHNWDHRGTAVFLKICHEHVLSRPKAVQNKMMHAMVAPQFCLTFFPVQERLVDCILSLRLLKRLQALAGILSHKPGRLSLDFDQLLSTHNDDHNTKGPTRGPNVRDASFDDVRLRCAPTQPCTPSPRTATQTKQRILHHRTYPEESQLSREIARAWSRLVQVVRLPNKIFLTAAKSSADVVLFFPSSSPDVSNWNTFWERSTICTSGSLSNVAST